MKKSLVAMAMVGAFLFAGVGMPALSAAQEKPAAQTQTDTTTKTTKKTRKSKKKGTKHAKKASKKKDKKTGDGGSGR